LFAERRGDEAKDLAKSFKKYPPDQLCSSNSRANRFVPKWTITFVGN
jgi:hypothetical protein